MPQLPYFSSDLDQIGLVGEVEVPQRHGTKKMNIKLFLGAACIKKW